MLSAGSMADELRWKAAQQDKQLYEVARHAAKVAQREGHAQVQAAVEAARVQGPHQRQQQHLASRTGVRSWTLKFGDARLEAAYIRKAKTNCDNHDHVASLCRLWACAPPVLMALSGHRLSCGVCAPFPPDRALSSPAACSLIHPFAYSGSRMLAGAHTIPGLLQWPLVSASRTGLYMCVMCNLFIAFVCALVFTLQLSFPAWYRSHRGTTLLWFASALWIVESVQLFVKADDLRVFISQILVPTVYMSFTYRLPYIVHLKSRAFGLGCQVVAILGSANYRHAPVLLLTSLFGNSVGVLLVYFLDRRARQGFLRSLPSWLLNDLHGSGSQPQIFQSYRASFSRQMWQIFYPELFETCKDPSRSTIRGERAAEPVSRRALGGFAGGFGGVSGLKCASSPSYTPMSLSSSNSSAPECESSSGECYAGLQASDGVKDPRAPLRSLPAPKAGDLESRKGSASSSGSVLDTQEAHRILYRGR